MRSFLFGSMVMSILLTVSLPLSALAHTCQNLFAHKQVLAESVYEAALLKSSAGRNDESERLIESLRERISTLPIVREFPEELGSHGAYRAELSDGTQVLIKPHNDNWFASIPKEVGASIYASLIGLPLVPVAGYRIDPRSGLPASVHLYLTEWRETSVPRENQYAGSNMNERYAIHYGTEINFLLSILDYSDYEIKPRHVLERTLKLPNSKTVKLQSLIDLGSAFIGRGDAHSFYRATDLLNLRVAPHVLSTIEALSFETFERGLAPYMPAPEIRAMYNLTRDYARMLRLIDPVTGEIDKAEFERAKKEFYEHSNKDDDHFHIMRQKWNWRDAMKPPQIAIDFGI